MALGTTIKSIQDILRKDPGVLGIDQLSWMLFLKVIEDQESEKEATHARYRSPIPHALRWRSWASGENALSGDDLLHFVNNQLFPGLQSLVDATPFSSVVRKLFSSTYNSMKSSVLLKQALEQLSEIDFSRSATKREAGLAYSQMLGDLRGNSGEYYTPRALAAFMVERIDPQLGEAVLDPACGTGGFLISVLEYLRKKQGESVEDEQLIQASIRGIEKNAHAYLICMTNMVLHGLDVSARIQHANALMPSTRRGEHVDIILTNPPFGGIEPDGFEKFVPPEFRTRKTEDLFLYYVMSRLPQGGRAAMIVPDGLLFGEGVKTRLKERLLAECNLHTIIRLPKGVFSPYTSIKTNLLFFIKGEPTKEIWYYEHPYPAGYKNYSKTKPLRIEEFEPERIWWHERKKTAQAWKVSIEDIKARDYSLDVQNPGEATGPVLSRLSSLKLRGFRGFASLDLELPREGSAVLIGANGAGKSTVLDAIAMLLSSFTALACGLTTRQADVQLGEGDIKVGDESATVNATLRGGDQEQFWELRASRARGVGPTGTEIAQQAESLRAGLQRSETASLPVLCFYSASRGLGEDGGSKRISYPFPQLQTYERAFRRGLGSFHDFVHWFRLEEGLENQVRLREHPSHRNPRLEIVRRALQCFLGELGDLNFSDLRIERSGEEKEGALVIEKEGVPLRVEQLSEGEKNTILLVSDLARRFAVANPGVSDPLKGEGIVLIDEIDMHLHPGWQRGLLSALEATFPGCQLIVSTHSPHVLSQVKKEHVFIFESFELVQVTPHTYGHDANSILSEVFGLPERSREIEEKIRAAAILIDEERVDEAEVALDDLLLILGDHDAEVLRLRTALSFVETPLVD